jgi:hypothetical protein
LKPIEDDLLAEERSELRKILAILDAKFSVSRSITSSPIFFLTDEITDNLLTLANILEEGSESYFGKSSPSIRFEEEIVAQRGGFEVPWRSTRESAYSQGDELFVSDPLGNPRQIVFHKPYPKIEDVDFASFIRDFIVELVTRFNAYKNNSYMESSVPQIVSGNSPTERREEPIPNPKKKAKYWLPDHVFYSIERAKDKKRRTQ